MGAQSTVRRFFSRAGGKARRLIPLAAALLLAALVAIPASNSALAQTPPSGELTLVNADREFVERKKGGEFGRPPRLRPGDSKPLLRRARRRHRRLDFRHVPRVGRGEEAQRRLGVLVGVPGPGRAPRTRPGPGLPAGHAGRGRGRQLRGDFYAVIPIHQPGRIWDKILSALSPARWAKAFAGWVIEGVHGTLCGVVERASGEDAGNCRGG